MSLNLKFAVLVLGCLLMIGCSESEKPGNSNTIHSTDSITIRDGQMTIGELEVTEAVQQEIYRSLNHRRKMITAAGNRDSNGRGAQQMKDELELLTKGFMTRFNLTRAEIAQILKRGDSLGWE